PRLSTATATPTLDLDRDRDFDLPRPGLRCRPRASHDLLHVVVFFMSTSLAMTRTSRAGGGECTEISGPPSRLLRGGGDGGRHEEHHSISASDHGHLPRCQAARGARDG